MDWNTPGYESLELSTQLLIKEALRRGHAVDVLDGESNFLRIRGKGKSEYVRQATRTSVDSYVSALIMENKKVTKQLLEQAGIRVPEGQDYTEMEAVRSDFPYWANRALAVKPNTTNFGIGVSLLPTPFSKDDYLQAAEAAFREDGTVLIEELVAGKEYRMLVIGDAVPAVLHRVPAHVSGDGRRTIEQLIQQKNRDPRRGKGYKTPLERLRMGPQEREFLAFQGLSFDSVPAAGVDVFLRKNSNISTGGDSIDLTDAVHPGYRDLAVASTAAVGARITGVDMIIEDISEPPNGHNYSVLELNYNPALHIHDFPHQGRNREVEKHVLDLLNL
jgi:glutamate--cysteine ligase